MERMILSSGEACLLFERHLLYHVHATKEHRKGNKYPPCL